MRKVLAAASVAVLMVAAACGNGDDERPRITVGSADFTESIVLAEIYSQALEAEGFDVDTRLRIGSREVYFPALETGEIDLMAEYTGSLVRFVTQDEGAATTDELQTYDNLVEALLDRGVTAFDFAQAQNRDSLVTNAETAGAHGLETFSDLEPVAGELILGARPECPEPQRLCGLLEAAGIEFSQVRPTDDATAVQLLGANEIQVTASLFSTDGRIAANDFILLEDDLGIVPAENIVPVVRDELVAAYGDELVDFIDSVTARLTTEALIELNRRVDVDFEDPSRVATDWLAAEGFVDG